MDTFDPQATISPDFEAAYKAALARGQDRKSAEPFAVSVHFNETTRSYAVRLTTGVGFEIQIDTIPELTGATLEQLGDVDLFGEGEGLHWEALDVDISVGSLINRAFGDTVRRIAARKAANVTSEARAAAARENGKKGGRPRKAAG